MNEHEDGFIRSFLRARYRERCLAKKGIPRDDIHHKVEQHLDPRYALALPPHVDGAGDRKGLADIIEALTSRRRFHGFAADGTEYELTLDDVRELPLPDSCIVSFEPGRVAWFCSETPPPRYLLVHDRALRERVKSELEQS